MRILLITNSTDKDRIKLQLRDLCESTSIIILNNIEKARDFINDQIIKFQLPLDLVIVYSTVNGRSGNDLRDFIRNDFERTFSKRDFSFDRVPIALIVEDGLNKSLYNNYDLIVDDYGIERLNLLVDSFSQTIRSWRKQVLEELDNLGIKFNSGIIDYEHYFSNKNKSFIPTNILSQNFKLFPRKLNYYWLDFNKDQIEKSIDDFIKMLKRSETIGKKGEEKLYHNFFNRNENFLLRDTYSKHWYEPRLHKNSKKFEEPDYTLKPNFSFETDLSLLEVKLPNETFLRKTNFHPPIKSSLMKHIFQVNDYKEYLESDDFLNQINNIFGFIPKNINYNILIGRGKDKEENQHQIEKRMRQLGQSKLNLMTFDDILEYQVKFLERMNLLNIK
jgi:hypothetical protein